RGRPTPPMPRRQGRGRRRWLLRGILRASSRLPCFVMLPTPEPEARPHGPQGIYGVRNTLRFASSPLSWLRATADQYGDVVSMKVLGRPWVLVSHPDDIERFLVKEARIMKRDDGAAIIRRVLGQGLLTSEGDLWKRQRKLMAQAFSPKRIHDYAAGMVRVTDESL